MPHGRYQGHLRTREYRAYKEWLLSEIIECHEAGCLNRAVTPDHIPPVSTFPHPSLWSGELKPHCKYHANRQGAETRWAKSKTPSATREW